MSAGGSGWMSWSSGKDSTFALHTVRAAGETSITGLLTTVNTSADRVAMHAVRRVLLEEQAAALGLPLHVIELPWPCSNDVYERQMADALETMKQAGVGHLVFGDLFLDDVRAYRERAMAGTGVEPMFPLWRRPTAELAGEMLADGIRAVITCVDPAQAPGSSRAAGSTRISCVSFPQVSTRAESAGSSIRSWSTDQVSRRPSTWWSARSSSGTGSSSPTSSQPERRCPARTSTAQTSTARTSTAQTSTAMSARAGTMPG